MENPVYTGFASPMGELYIRKSSRGVTDLAIGLDEAGFLEKMVIKYGGSPVHNNKPFGPVLKELEGYFKGKTREFEAPLDLCGSAFELRVWKAISSTGWGKTKSYSEIAREAGSPKGARAAGGACGKNPVPIIVPCHRVLASSGKLGGYTGGQGIKRALLEIEGIVPAD